MSICVLLIMLCVVSKQIHDKASFMLLVLIFAWMHSHVQIGIHVRIQNAQWLIFASILALLWSTGSSRSNVLSAEIARKLSIRAWLWRLLNCFSYSSYWLIFVLIFMFKLSSYVTIILRCTSPPTLPGEEETHQGWMWVTQQRFYYIPLNSISWSLWIPLLITFFYFVFCDIILNPLFIYSQKYISKACFTMYYPLLNKYLKGS